MQMQWTQISGILDRVLIAALTFLAAKGYISSNEVGNIAALVLTIAGAIWGFYVNTPKAILQAAAEIPAGPSGQKTVVVTSPELAKATPDQNNIVSSSDMKVTPK